MLQLVGDQLVHLDPDLWKHMFYRPVHQCTHGLDIAGFSGHQGRGQGIEHEMLARRVRSFGDFLFFFGGEGCAVLLPQAAGGIAILFDLLDRRRQGSGGRIRSAVKRELVAQHDAHHVVEMAK